MKRRPIRAPSQPCPRRRSEDDSGEGEPRARRSLFPDGALGIFFLLIVAAASGGLIAAYWPWVQGGGNGEVPPTTG